ncbi:MAG: hypothetical protein JNK87_18075 [Bryobacterales bacterium]|nr:hypothetical protein [Bryobacterales bacterium]
MTRPFFLLLLALPLFPASKYDRLSTQEKLDLIEAEKIPPGTKLDFTEKEMNTFVSEKAKVKVKQGIRDTNLIIEAGGRVTGTALVDLAKMRQAQGADLGWLMSWILEGERPIKVIGKLSSSNGSGRVDLERVEIGGVAIKGRALEMLIRTFVTPLYPQAKIGQSFELGYNMERIELEPRLARVVINTTHRLNAAD